MNPNRPFAALLAIAAAASGILLAVIVRYVRAGIPAGGQLPQFLTWRYVVLPGVADFPIHLVSYLALGLLAAGLARALRGALGRGRRTRRFLARCRAERAGLPTGLRRLAARASLAGRLELVAAPEPLAFCHGLLRPRVCVTTGLLGLLDPEELRAVLLHEAHHVARRDPLRRCVADWLATALFFLPLVGMLRDHHAVASEVAADRWALERMGGERCLAAALYKLLSRGGDAPSPAPVGVSGSLAARVDLLLGRAISPRELFPPRGLAWTALGFGLLLALLVVPLSLFAGDLLHFHGHGFPRFR